MYMFIHENVQSIANNSMLNLPHMQPVIGQIKYDPIYNRTKW